MTHLRAPARDPSLPVRAAERGSALVLALLIMLAMTGLGLLAMRTTTHSMAASGNLRLSKQARYVAEMGLYHAMTVMATDGARLLALRDQRNAVLELDSDGVWTTLYAPDFVVLGPDSLGPGELTPPEFFDGGGESPLGAFAVGAGLRPAYRVRVEGFTPGPAPAGNPDLQPGGEGLEGYCFLQFTSHGYITTGDEVPSDDDFEGLSRDLTAETRLKGALVLGPFNRDLCQWEIAGP